MDEKTLNTLKERWEELLRDGQSMTFRKRQVLFYEGHTPYGLLVIESPDDITFSKDETRCGVPHFWDAPKGKVIGLRHFFDETPNCCTCTAKRNCRVTFISKSQLLPFLKAPAR